MIWTSAAFAGSLVLLGEAPFRAPDGISDVALADDGRVLTMSARGELARFDASGRLLGTLPGCPDRLEHLRFTASRDLGRVGVACGFSFHLLELPSGRRGPVIEVDVTDAALSPDGRRVALLGERSSGQTTDEQSYLFEFDARTGELIRRWPGTWDRVLALPVGWLVARGDDDGTELELEAFLGAPGQPVKHWTHQVDPARLAGGGWTTESSPSLRDRWVCVAHDGGGTCLDATTGEPDGTWTPADRPFEAPGPTSVVRSPNHRQTLAVRRTHLRRPDVPFDSWTRPRHVAIAGDTLLVTDEGDTVYRVEAGQITRFQTTPGTPALAPDGRTSWIPAEDGSWRMGDARVDSPRFPVATFLPDGQLLGVDGQALVQVDGSRFAELPRRYEVTGLRADRAGLLVEHAQDDRVLLFDPKGELLLDAEHVFRPTDDVASIDGALRETRTQPARQIGPVGGPWRPLDAQPYDRVRFLPDGRLAVVPHDQPVLRILNASGEEAVRQPLPARAYDLWVGQDRVVVGLEDGRLAVLPL